MPTPLFSLWQLAADVALENDTPQVVIYEDGTVIARRSARPPQATGGAPASAALVTRRLRLDEVNIWYDDIFAIVRDEELKSVYNLDNSGRAPVAVFHFAVAGRGFLVRVRGLADTALSPFGTLLNRDAEDVPARLLRVFQDARRLTLDGATPWQPASIEARVMPTRYQFSNTRTWPADWPNPLAAAHALVAGGAAVMLDASAAGVGRLAGLSGWFPFSLGGEVRLVWFRPVLPGEALWRRQIEADAEQARAVLATNARNQLDAERGQIRVTLEQRVGATGIATPAAVAPPAADARLQPPPIDQPDLTVTRYPVAPTVPNGKMKPR